MTDGAGSLAALPAALPEGTRLLHIGPPKTGTTSLQAAFWAAKEEAIRQGVRYAGKSRHSSKAVLAVTGRRSFAEDRAIPPISHWDAVLREIRGATEPRVVLSSEGFSYAKPAAIERVVRDLERDRLQVVVTLRPIARLVASEWQEHAQSGMRLSLEAYLDALFRDGDPVQHRLFWHRQRHDQLIERWAEQVGIDRMSAIVVDETDHGRLYRVFEALIGLRAGTLVPEAGISNRSLTLPEIVAVRALADRFEAEGYSMAAFHRVVRMKVAASMKGRVPGPDELRIDTPQWALDAAGDVAREVVAGIRASGVRVIGDLDSLTVVPTSRLAGDALPDVTIPPEVAASMAMGALHAGHLEAELTGAGTRASAASTGEPPEVARIPSRRLAGILLARGRRAVARRLRLRR